MLEFEPSLNESKRRSSRSQAECAISVYRVLHRVVKLSPSTLRHGVLLEARERLKDLRNRGRIEVQRARKRPDLAELWELVHVRK